MGLEHLDIPFKYVLKDVTSEDIVRDLLKNFNSFVDKVNK